MAQTITLTGQVNADQTTGTLDVDLRQGPGQGGLITAETQLIKAIPVPATPAATIVTVAGAPGGARFVKITLLGQSGETIASSELSVGTATAGQGVTIPSPPATAGATQWQPYISATTGTETKQASPINIGTAYTETSAGITTNLAPAPTKDTTGYNAGSCTVTITQP